MLPVARRLCRLPIHARHVGAVLPVCTRGYAARKKTGKKDKDKDDTPAAAVSLEAAVKSVSKPVAPKAAASVGDGTLSDALANIEKAYGKGSIRKLGETMAESVEVISTGSLGLDVALGVGGLPRGRITEIFGPEMSGKTTLALSLIAQAQKQGGTCTFIDAEHALDASYARRIGVNTDAMYVCQPDNGEQALEVADTLVRSNSMDVVVVDSVAALVPRAELEGQMGDHHVGLQARLMSQALRKLTASLANSKTVLVFINQLRMKVGIIFGSPEVTAGGVGLKYYSSVRIDIRRTGSLKRGEEIVANQVRVKVAKSKISAPFRTAEFDIDFGRGISRAGEVADAAVAEGILTKAGAWYAYKGENVAQGRDKVKAWLEGNAAVLDEIDAAVRKVLLERARQALPAAEDTPAQAAPMTEALETETPVAVPTASADRPPAAVDDATAVA